MNAISTKMTKTHSTTCLYSIQKLGGILKLYDGWLCIRFKVSHCARSSITGRIYADEQYYTDGMSPYTYYNLGREHGDLLSLSDHMSTLLHALGGNNIPHVLLKSALSPQKRWGVDGEMASTGGAALGLPKGILNVLSSQSQLDQALTAPHIVRETLHDGTITWSIRPEVIKSLAEGLSTEIITEFGLMALKVICLACPPCYLGDTEW